MSIKIEDDKLKKVLLTPGKVVAILIYNIDWNISLQHFTSLASLYSLRLFQTRVCCPNLSIGGLKNETFKYSILLFWNLLNSTNIDKFIMCYRAAQDNPDSVMATSPTPVVNQGSLKTGVDFLWLAQSNFFYGLIVILIHIHIHLNSIQKNIFSKTVLGSAMIA